MSPTARAGALERPGRRPVAPSTPNRRLSVLDRAVLADRARSRRARAIVGLAAIVLASALVIVVGTQALVASQQISLDSARQQLAQAVAEEQQLQFRRADLEAPARILALAEHDLHMVAPAQVTYIAARPTGPTLGGQGLRGRSTRAPGGGIRAAAP